MAPAGRKPNEGTPVRHSIKPVHEWYDVPDAPYAGDAPSLPKPAPGQPSWPIATKRWWKAVSHMPHCILWRESDWQFAIDSAYVAAVFHRDVEKSAATELRRREAVLGVTLDSRRGLRIRYVPAVQEGAGGVVDLDSYRESLRG